MDGQTDKNRQTIAVTLRLRFVARVYIHIQNYSTKYVDNIQVSVKILYSS